MAPNKHPNPSAQHTRVETVLRQLNGEVTSLLEENAGHLREINKLQSELNVYKRAYGDIESERDKLEQLKIEVEKKNMDLETRLKVSEFVDSPGSDCSLTHI
ncbi:hypothetical protein K435DRAFT_168826 [Dendrothele bispora CBS 962.96]|uniref:Uncharacterized protein n=1 Tax=Dendrothele bispora (strain CBS 962.96) TaxID=1314807 RepID=A0A4S8MWP0_DENBC|nr:hypothetical protein K435DRAFT_168826 [Dendrothele bispora CBS 962.96]